jgi:hypothetical protein
MKVVKKSWVLQTAIQALIAREENPETREMNTEEYLESIYELVSDWHWARESESREEAALKEATND